MISRRGGIRTVGGAIGALLILAPWSGPPQASGAGAPGLEVASYQLIWDRAPHNAFTDLIRFRGQWYCSFREGSTHGSMDGTARVLRSKEGNDWKSVAHLAVAGQDLRDPKLVVTPGGRLMCGAGVRSANEDRQPMVWFSEDGQTWSAGEAVGERDHWMWGWERSGEWVYSFGYQVKANPKYGSKSPPYARLYRSRDTVTWEKVTDVSFGREFINETALSFAPDGRAFALMRSDSGPAKARIGSARPPYTDWTWHPTEARIGGPALLVLPDGRLLGGGRNKVGNDRKTKLFWIDPATGGLTDAVELPSTHETGYPGLALDGNSVWASYYSSQGGKPGIYVARLRWKR